MISTLLLAQATQPTAATPPHVESAAIEFFVNLSYLIAAVLFCFGLKMLSSPRTARRGNVVAAVGMLIAVVVTLLDNEIVGYTTIIVGCIVGGVIGAVWARVVPMTSMPETVALFNGWGGIASAIVALAEYWRFGSDKMIAMLGAPYAFRGDTALTIGLSVLIGMVTFTGSLVAFAKLRGMTIGGVRLGNPIMFPQQHLAYFGLLALTIFLVIVLTMNPAAQWAVIIIALAAAVIGVLFTLPIGGADMPVVVCLLNSFSGLAACATGFVLENTGLIVSGSLVGASGIILTDIMCRAMDRSWGNVLAGGFGQDVATAGATTAREGLTVRKMDAEEAAMVLEAAQSVVIVPGYGMAVAQAQHVVAELAEILRERGINVRFGIHPVAGRMPGHMNVLLAEANVDYELLHDLELNPEMPQIDVALIVGANDVVNPDARDNPQSQIYGMPIFEVDKCKTVMVCKRSLNPGFAGIENPLFFKENTTMLFGDAKKFITEIVTELKGK
ncbi:MAG: NAD(P)(+) transhydrogenase (Re/Si-specific) subunit beta [Planctomycetota bacterium]|nr:MAG: NAD(P)(+) transhydrogenase (Re/Si-specific) subunit beta [Planctomycetota bacterium]